MPSYNGNGGKSKSSRKRRQGCGSRRTWSRNGASFLPKLRGVQNITPDEVKKNMEIRIRDLGMFTARKQTFRFWYFMWLSGASEIMMSGLRNGFLETTVTACDGAGTVIASNPYLVPGNRRQNVRPDWDGANRGNNRRDSKKLGGTVLDPSTAAIDPVGGVRKSCRTRIQKDRSNHSRFKKLQKPERTWIELRLDLDNNCRPCYRRQHRAGSGSSG